METLTLTPRGDVSKSYDFGTKTVEYESGVKQYQRKWTKPRITFSFEVEGDKDMKDYLDEFIVARGGNVEAFYWVYEGTTYPVRFADSKVEFTEIRGYGGEGTVGYKGNISLMVCKESEY